MEQGLYLVGRVLKTEHVMGKTNEGKGYDFWVFHILAGVEVFECGVARSWVGQYPEQGDELAFEVVARGKRDKFTGAVGLGVDLVRVVSLSEFEGAGNPARALAAVD